MKKIRLDIAALRVVSFDTEHVPGTRGTVRGAESDAPTHASGCCADQSFQPSFGVGETCTCPDHLTPTLQETCDLYLC